LGHREIGFITGRHEVHSAAERQAGYMQALADQGITPHSEHIVEGDFLEAGGAAAARKLMALEHRPTAVFAANDLSALGAIEAFREGGLRIPQDISILGFDDIPQASLVYPKLTTVHQPLNHMGRVAVRMLLEHMEAPDKQMKQVTLDTQLVIRDSCMPPRGN
jgi:LacI family transcriptional regulator